MNDLLKEDNREHVMKHVERLNANENEMICNDINTVERAFNTLLHYNDNDLSDSVRLALLEDLDMLKLHLLDLIICEPKAEPIDDNGNE